MLTGATVLITIFSALSLGIIAGWAVLAAVLHLFFATKTTEPKQVPARVTAVGVAASHTA